MSKRLVCLCNLVDEGEIVSCLKKGANTTSDIQYLTLAGTSCGRCLPVIDEIVSSYHKDKPTGQQGVLDFGLKP
jgi:bacterioferritin-associated ferredoxin